jgi:hypothetical protein
MRLSRRAARRLTDPVLAHSDEKDAMSDLRVLEHAASQPSSHHRSAVTPGDGYLPERWERNIGCPRPEELGHPSDAGQPLVTKATTA